MSAEPETTRTTPDELRETVWGVLAQLRQRIRNYITAISVSRLVILLGGLFWLSLLVDQLYFMATNLELSVGFRKFLLGASFVGLPVFLLWSIWPLFRQMQSRSLALVLERRFPQLNDRLITTVEFLQDDQSSLPELTRQMLGRTVREVGQQIKQLPITDVFERRPIQRGIITAVAVTLSVLVFLVMNQEAAARWKNAYVDLAPSYWERNTQLEVQVVAQPSDQVREFDSNREYKHARGRDLVVLVTVPEGINPDGEPWVIPERVRLDLTSHDESSYIVLNRTGDREFQYTFTKLLHDLEFDVQGGDYRSPESYHVRLVEPPQIEEIALECDYPEYTRLAPIGRDGQPQLEMLKVQGSQISIPHETKFLLNCKSNKSLVRASIRTDHFEVNLDPEQTTWTPLREEGEPQPAQSLNLPPEAGIFPDSRLLSFPFVLSKTVENGDEPNIPARFGPSALIRIVLEDVDGVISDQPIRLNITGIEDEAPLIETELQGISNSITRKAVIPVQGLIRDDYGVVKARFEYRVEEEEKWQPRPFRSRPNDSPVEYILERSESEDYELFEVLPLDLSIGQRLTLTVYAEDGDTINGPHESRSQQYVFNIVDTDELLSLLYNKELNLRRRFERIIEEMEKAERDFDAARQQVDELEESLANSGAAEQQVQFQRSLAVAGQRGLFQIRKNRSETRAVEESFQSLLEESVNNGVDTAQMIERIQELITDPLRRVHEVSFPKLDAELGLFKLAIEESRSGRSELTEVTRTTARILAEMRGVLEEMRDLLEFHEALQDLKEIIDTQKNLSEETEKQQKENLIDSLKSLGIE
ncbi:hypothetical protein Pla110_14120 [Polystyrenella longa]|uniref:Uncharacterized protein n=2 Tax=Polystyrenella longa TaxID=2528007 RepID=A0A518CKE2_9PLAN|nr:hypothetical protein Pla110_14120 [Polystyrenella longa]